MNARNQIAFLVTGLLTVGLPLTARASIIELSATGAGGEITIDFDSTVTGSNNGAFEGAGFTPGAGTAGQLDSDSWSVLGLSDGDITYGGTGTSGDFARGTSEGGVTNGGIYGFDVSNSPAGVDRALGVQPSGADFTAGSLTLRVRNNTGTTLNSINVAYDALAWNDQNRANSLNFSYADVDDSTFIDVSSLDFTSPGTAAGSPSWASTDRSATNLALNVANGEFFFLRWTSDDVSGGGSRDELAIDNIRFSGFGDMTPIPEPGSVLFLLSCCGGAALCRRRRNPAATA